MRTLDSGVQGSMRWRPRVAKIMADGSFRVLGPKYELFSENVCTLRVPNPNFLSRSLPTLSPKSSFSLSPKAVFFFFPQNFAHQGTKFARVECQTSICRRLDALGKTHAHGHHILTTVAVGTAPSTRNGIMACFLYIEDIVFALIDVKRISTLIKLHYRISFGINSVGVPAPLQNPHPTNARGATKCTAKGVQGGGGGCQGSSVVN